MRPEPGGYLFAWRPVLRDMSDDVRAVWGLAAARAIDALQNSGWLAGGVDQARTDTVGPTGLKLNSTPDADALGWSADYRTEWTAKVERRWSRWASNPLECDIAGKSTVAQMMDTSIGWHYGYGEVTALLRRVKRPQSRSLLKVQMVPPHRLSLETDESRRLRQGIFHDADAMPIAYRFKRRVGGTDQPFDVPTWGRNGQRQVVHVFDGDVSQVRGITPLAPVLKVIRQYDQLADATLTTTLLQTIHAATITSPPLSGNALEGMMGQGDGIEAVSDAYAAYMGQRLSYWQGDGKHPPVSLDLGQHGKVNHLFAGEELKFHGAEHPSDNYQPFSRGLLREVARCMGITYAALTGDHEGENYASLNMGNSGLWRVTLRRRDRVPTPLVHAIFCEWLDEDIRTGGTDFPGGYEVFRQNRDAATAAAWQGPAKAVGDDLKAARAMGERLERGVTSLSYECGELGLDADQMMMERAEETRRAAQLGLADPHAPKGSPLVGTTEIAEADA